MAAVAEIGKTLAGLKTNVAERYRGQQDRLLRRCCRWWGNQSRSVGDCSRPSVLGTAAGYAELWLARKLTARPYRLIAIQAELLRATREAPSRARRLRPLRVRGWLGMVQPAPSQRPLPLDRWRRSLRLGQRRRYRGCGGRHPPAYW